MAARTSALSLPVEPRSRAVFQSYACRTPLFTLTTGGVLVSLTLPERLSAAHVEFARGLAEQAAAYAIEVERLYRNGGASRKAAA
ncbi:hypothetical protein NE236_05810 [Actinoallomurus purpureus]|uniref:hypothetical protein n=1 Tax=Actinoallomurus purpureus TaxID=478114 RepID=UPI002091EE13|nr:hypothetical protein [Actinoallomurus purpureus]MCO6004491.1 hypothetical protein [Actinoallomurus purpureus]